jgi:hypothetical protein
LVKVLEDHVVRLLGWHAKSDFTFFELLLEGSFLPRFGCRETCYLFLFLGFLLLPGALDSVQVLCNTTAWAEFGLNVL